MTTYNGADDLHVDYRGYVYKVRRVTRGWRVWKKSINGWLPMRDGGELHDDIVSAAIDQESEARNAWVNSL